MGLYSIQQFEEHRKIHLVQLENLKLLVNNQVQPKKGQEITSQVEKNWYKEV